LPERPSAPIIRAVPKLLTLTFDNGPRPGVTEQVLAILGERGLKATFFMVGSKAADPAARETIERVAAAGHRIGNHTFTHGAPLGVDADEERPPREIGEAEETLRPYLGTPPLFRPNGRAKSGPHLLNAAAVDYLIERGYTVVTWNCVPRDFEPPGDAWVERALEGIAAQDHTLLVLHDHIETMPEQLPGFLDRVAELGVEFTDEFPADCLPIVAGRPMWRLDGSVANGTPH
jgi:peptidoglycan-N-acetylglucosamine deacetylase